MEPAPIFLCQFILILCLLPASDTAEVVEEPSYINATHNILPYAIGDTITNLLLRSAGEDVKNIAKEEIFAKAIKIAVKLYTKLAREKHSSHVDQMIDGQKYLEQKIKSLLKKMRKWMVISGYTDDESLIKNSLWYLDRHLHNPDDKESLKDFHKLAVKLPRHINNILDGMLGRNSLSADIMIELRKADKVRKKPYYEYR